jgi:PAP_fibrillin
MSSIQNTHYLLSAKLQFKKMILFVGGIFLLATTAVNAFQPSVIVQQWTYRPSRVVTTTNVMAALTPAVESDSQQQQQQQQQQQEQEQRKEIETRESIVMKLRQELIDLGQRTERGFRASRSDRERAGSIIFDLAQYSSVREPASMYYNNDNEKQQFTSSTTDYSALPDDTVLETVPSLQGQWTLIYTDAPDITSLGQPSPFVELGRIGQDCSQPPYISNIIEWLSPTWASNVPILVGKSKNSARILQKVVTTGRAVPASPTVVDLSVAGLQLATKSTALPSLDTGNTGLREAIEQDGLIVGLLQQQQGTGSSGVDLLRLEKSQQPPFGSFEILYLDDDFRITKTNRNHFAVNLRVCPGEEWF